MSQTEGMIAITPWRRTLSTWVHPHDELYTLNPDYVDGITAVGGTAALIPHVADVDAAKRQVAGFSGLLISGGDDIDPAIYGHELDGSNTFDAAVDRSDLAHFEAARSLGLPILGICRGLQLINVAFGGTLHQHVWQDGTDHPPRTGDTAADCDAFLANRHLVELEPGTLAARVFGELFMDVNSLHHQAADKIGRELVVSGRAPDGTVEVLEHHAEQILAVQWHPERLGADGLHVFRWLVESARR